jgi:dihydrofolate synthase/folylpolyglutamate synthase
LGKDFAVEGCMENICAAAKITGLRGRWETLCEAPLVICDTGHNSHGFKVLGPQIARTASVQQEKFPGSRFRMVFGVVADKDLESIVEYLPRNAYYHYVNARGTRALPAQELAAKMEGFGFEGEVAAGSIGECLAGLVPDNGAGGSALKEDFIFIGGSTFVVAEALEYFG